MFLQGSTLFLYNYLDLCVYLVFLLASTVYETKTVSIVSGYNKYFHIEIDLYEHSNCFKIGLPISFGIPANRYFGKQQRRR